MRPKVETPTDEEEAMIQRGIAADAPEVTDAQLASMRPAAEVVPHIVRRRGSQKAPTKIPVSLRLDADVVDALRATGEGWQTRANALLRTALDLQAS